MLNPTEGPCAALQSCAASEVPSVRSSFDEQDQLDKVEVVLLEGETVIAGYDGGDTGFIGLTDRRVILQDNEFDGSRSALTSCPFTGPVELGRCAGFDLGGPRRRVGLILGL